MQLNFGMFGGAVAENIADNVHGMARRIDIRVADHEFLEDIVLDGAGELLRGDALLFGGNDIEGHDREDGAVHGHGNGHLVERNFVEENFHVLDAVDGDSGFSHVAGDARVVGIVTAVRGEVESDAESLLAGGEIAAIEGVGIFGRGKAGVLTDCPWTQCVHGGVWAAKEWRKTGGVVQMFDGCEIVGGV